MGKSGTLAERFATCVMPEPNSGCWLWIAANSYGYGDIWDRGTKYKAHRLSYEWAFGPIPPGLHVLHKCDVPAYVNPDHLFVGTPADNMRDKARKGRAVGGFVRGEQHGCAKLTREQARTIKGSLDSSGVLGKRFGVSRTTIKRIKAGKLWKEMTNG